MGYAYYEIGGMERGYGVKAVCHWNGCKEEIHRGLSFLCYECTQYFCEKHQRTPYCEHKDEPIEADCFAGQGSQMCLRCCQLNEEADHVECLSP